MIEITESEYVKLIKLSSRDRCVEGSFGAGRVSLDETPENAWAIKELLRIRGVAAKGGGDE